MADSTELVHLSRSRSVATVTMDSPANRNALSRRLVVELTQHLRAADADDDVRAIVLTHTGTTFCAGADLTEAATVGMEQGTRALLDLLRTVVTLSTPVLALVRGHVRAGGVGLVGACDLALVSDDATFAFTEVLLGLTPAIISLTTRNRLRARDAERLYLTGEVFDGRAAAAVGLVTASASADSVDAAVEEMLAALRRASPQGLRETKALLSRSVVARMGADGEELVALSARLFASTEAAEGMAAFRERRQPPWQLDAE